MNKAEALRLGELESRSDGIGLDDKVGAELFAVVDLLDRRSSLRRALTNPASEPKARFQLVSELFGDQISQTTLAVMEQALALRWQSGKALSDALERLGVRAYLKAAQATGELDQVMPQLLRINQLVSANFELFEALNNRTYPVSARAELITELVGDDLHPFAKALVTRAVAARQGRFDLSVDHYLEQAAELRNRRLAKVRVARPLPEDQEKRLRAALIKNVGHDLDLQILVDPEILGGISVQVGHEVIDSTVASRLEEVRRQLSS